MKTKSRSKLNLQTAIICCPSLFKVVKFIYRIKIVSSYVKSWVKKDKVQIFTIKLFRKRILMKKNLFNGAL